MAGILSTTLFFAAVLPGQTSTTRPAPTDQQIQQAVEQLASPVFARRQEASDFLWRAGRETEPALRRALTHRDPEVVFRAKSILEQFRYGILPDTPPEVVALIEMYRRGDYIRKRAALQQLRDRGAAATLLALLRIEPDDSLRARLVREFASNVDSMVSQLLVEGKIDEAETLLELAAETTDDAARSLAALLLSTGRLDARIAALREKLKDAAPDDTLRRRLFYFLRAAGKADEALAVAEELGPRYEPLHEGLLFEMRDWRRLARYYDDQRKENAGLAGNVDYLGNAATAHRLSGDTAAFESDVKSIVQLAGEESQAWSCAEALMVNGRFREGIDAVRTVDEASAFRLLLAQMRNREAFQLVGLGELDDDPLPWFRRLAKDLQSNDEELRDRLPLGLTAGRALYRFARRDEALAAFALVGEALAADENGERLEELCEAERRLGLVEQAFDHGALALAKGPEGSALAALFPKQTDEANVWWQFFRERSAEFSHRETLDRIAPLLSVASAKGEDDARIEATKLINQAARQAASFDKDRRSQWYQALAETALRHGERLRSKELLGEVAGSSAAAALRLADLCADDEDWTGAARWYEQVSEDVEHRCLAMYLRGRALRRLGDDEAGQRLMDLALLLPLAEGATRYELAKGLKERGLIKEAIDQWRFVQRTVPVRDWYSSNASLSVGNTISGKDYLGAADQWEALALSVLKSSSRFVEVEGYLQLPHLVHKSRARGLLAEGKQESALENLWIAQAAYPGSIDLAEDLIPELEAAGMRGAADELFAKVYAPNQQLCDDFPENASAHNNLAWLAARSGRRLEDALHHARRAVELEPDSAAYLDTLAEALFRTGGREEAVALERRCLSQEPENEHYQKQLARFQSD